MITNQLQPVELIKNKEQHTAYLGEVQRLMKLDPPKGTPEGDRLGLLVLVIQDYENEHYPLPKPEPVAHMFASDLELFEREETSATAYSVAMGYPGGKTVPLYTEPQQGNWINAEDVNRLVRELDIAINGENAVPQASLCDLVAQVKKQELRAVPAGLLGACAHLARQHAPKLHAELVTVIFGKDHPHAKAAQTKEA